MEITLNEAPPQKWIKCFHNPNQFTISFHPMNIGGNKIITVCEEANIDSVLDWADKYIKQANEAYDALLEFEAREVEKEKNKKQEEKKEIQNINKRLALL